MSDSSNSSHPTISVVTGANSGIGRATVELSGGITLYTVRAYAESGADYISAGAMTHSATAVNINFRLQIA